MRARSFLEEVWRELAPLNKGILGHPFIVEAREGSLPRHKIRSFVVQQHYIVRHDLASISIMLSRARSDKEVEFFKTLLEGDLAAYGNLREMAEELGLDWDRISDEEVIPEAVTYTHYMAWLALYATPGEQAFAMIVNLPVWGANCGALAEALERNYGLRKLGFLKGFAEVPEWFVEKALAVIEDYLPEGAKNMRRIARLIQAYEKMFWDGVYRAGGATP